VRVNGEKITVSVAKAPGASAAWLMVDTGVAAVM
jgi:hypothetical protein